MIIEPDHRTIVGPYYVDLWKGFFHDEIRVWKDVRPALGGLIAKRTVWHWQSAALYATALAHVRGLVEQSLVEDH